MTTIIRHRTAVPSLLPIVVLGIVAGCGPNPATADEGGEWAALASMNIARQECGAAMIGENVYVVGGLLAGFPLTATDTVEVYDVAMNTWTLSTSMPAALDHMAVAAVNGKLYVMGGDGRTTASVFFLGGKDLEALCI